MWHKAFDFSLLIIVVLAVLSAATYELVGAVDQLKASFGITNSWQINSIFFIDNIVFFFVAPFVGALAQFLHRGTIAISVVFLTILTLAFYMLAGPGNNFAWLQVGSGFSGLAQAFVLCNLPMILHSFCPPNKQNRWFGTLVALVNLAGAIGFLATRFHLQDVTKLWWFFLPLFIVMGVFVLYTIGYWTQHPESSDTLVLVWKKPCADNDEKTKRAHSSRERPCDQHPECQGKPSCCHQEKPACACGHEECRGKERCMMVVVVVEEECKAPCKPEPCKPHRRCNHDDDECCHDHCEEECRDAPSKLWLFAAIAVYAVMAGSANVLLIVFNQLFELYNFDPTKNDTAVILFILLPVVTPYIAGWALDGMKRHHKVVLACIIVVVQTFAEFGFFYRTENTAWFYFAIVLFALSTALLAQVFFALVRRLNCGFYEEHHLTATLFAAGQFGTIAIFFGFLLNPNDLHATLQTLVLTTGVIASVVIFLVAFFVRRDHCEHERSCDTCRKRNPCCEEKPVCQPETPACDTELVAVAKPTKPAGSGRRSGSRSPNKNRSRASSPRKQRSHHAKTASSVAGAVALANQQ